MSNLKVGFVGLGDQGAPMARAVSEAGFQLHVWARRPASYEEVARVKFVQHPDMTSLVAAADVLCLCLRNDDDVWAVLKQQGVSAAFRANTIVVNQGTGDPAGNKRIAEFLRPLGVEFLDAPVSGGHAGAEARTLTTFVGGDAKAYDICESVFKSFSRKVSLMGGVGAGQTAKLLNNALTMSNLKNAADVFGLAGKLGVNLTKLQEVLSVSSGSSAVLQAIGVQITPANAPHLSGLMQKDIEEFDGAMRESGLDASQVREQGLGGARELVNLVNAIAAH